MQITLRLNFWGKLLFIRENITRLTLFLNQTVDSHCRKKFISADQDERPSTKTKK